MNSRLMPPGGVGEDHGFHAHARENANGKGDVLGGIAFVEMDAALHSGHGNFADFADDELACVADGGGAWKVWDFRVGNFGGACRIRRRKRRGPSRGPARFRGAEEFWKK